MPPKRKDQNLLAGELPVQKKSKESSDSSDPSVNDIVALASTLGLTGAPDLQDDDGYVHGYETTAWDNQHYEVRIQKYCLA